MVIAVNLNSELLGRGATIVDAGNETGDRSPPESPPDQSDASRGWAPERAIKRQFFASPKRPGIPTVMVDAFNIMQDRITRARLAGDPPDVTINPRMTDVGWFDFHRAKDAIALGARAAERALEQIDEAIVALAPRSA
jgi:NTE family protein